MIKCSMHYYNENMEFEIPKESYLGTLQSRVDSYAPLLSVEEIVSNALRSPIGSVPLGTLVCEKKHVAIITSDHTRPVPSRITMPLILKEIREVNPDVKITIIIATGMHRRTTQEELIDKFGADIVSDENIIVHDANDESRLVYKGVLPSQGELWINKIVDEADLLIAEGFIEPHFFAGFSGGRKAVLPGIAGIKSILWNHNSRFLSHNRAKSGSLQSNPIHEDMVYASSKTKLAFILNVVLNSDKKIINAFGGDATMAHEAGCEFVLGLARVPKKTADIVITSNGGYPLDQNIYQAVKGITTARLCLNDNGVIIMVASCVDGHGSKHFYDLISQAGSPVEAYNNLVGTKPEETKPDGWQALLLARALCKCKVIIVSKHCPPELITSMHMIHAYSIEEALVAASALTSKAGIILIPDGINVIIEDELP